MDDVTPFIPSTSLSQQRVLLTPACTKHHRIANLMFSTNEQLSSFSSGSQSSMSETTIHLSCNITSPYHCNTLSTSPFCQYHHAPSTLSSPRVHYHPSFTTSRLNHTSRAQRNLRALYIQPHPLFFFSFLLLFFLTKRHRQQHSPQPSRQRSTTEPRNL